MHSNKYEDWRWFGLLRKSNAFQINMKNDVGLGYNHCNVNVFQVNYKDISCKCFDAWLFWINIGNKP